MGSKPSTLVHENENDKSQVFWKSNLDQANQFLFSGKTFESQSLLRGLLDNASDNVDSFLKIQALALLIRAQIEAGKYEEASATAREGHLIEKQILASGSMSENNVRLALSTFYYERSVLDYSRTCYSSALSFARAAEKMAPSGELFAQMRAKYILSTILATTGFLEEAEKDLGALESLAPHHDKHPLASFINILRGEILRFRGDNNSAIQFYEKALELEKNNKNSKLYHSILLNMSKAFKAMDQFDKAAMYLSLVENSIDTVSFIRFNMVSMLEKIDLTIDRGDLGLAEELLGDYGRKLGIQVDTHVEPDKADPYLIQKFLLLKIKYHLARKELDQAEYWIGRGASAVHPDDNPIHSRFLDLKRAQLSLLRGELDLAFKLAEECFIYFERAGMSAKQISSLWIMTEALMSRQDYAYACTLLRKKMSLEIRFAHYRNYVHSSLLMSVAMKHCGQSAGCESILLNALKVVHRVNLQAERAAIYKLLGEDQNFEREYACLSREEKEKIERFLRKYDISELFDYDLVIDQNTNSVVHHELGTISFGNKFSLMKILAALAEAGGKSVNKEVIAQKLWGRPYNPLVDDNTIYIHMNRLRKVLEMEPSKPSLIINTADGYQLSSQLRVRLVPLASGNPRDRFVHIKELLERTGPLTAKDVQSNLRLSKATIARELTRWVQEGRVERRQHLGQYIYSLPQQIN